MSRPSRLSRLALAVVPVAALGLVATAPGSTAATTATARVSHAAATPREHVTFTQWDFGDHGRRHVRGRYDGTRVRHHLLRLAHPTATRSYTDPFADHPTARRYDEGTWTSPWVRTRFGLTELVSSWNARTPGGSWIETTVQGVADNGARSKWYVLGRWADHDTAFHPTSVPNQGDDLATVYVDTLATRTGHTFDSYRIRVALMRPHGSRVSPRIGMMGAMASNVPDTSAPPVAPPTTMRRTKVLDVPTFSQELHRGDFPEYDNGGEAWCSPTSTSMDVAYWGRGPAPWQYAYVTDRYGKDHPDPQVDYAARHTFDYDYDGAGNWPFNAAYAAEFHLEGFVTRIRNLDEAERFIKAGIPLVTSVSFDSSELDGAGYSTDGHLMVIVGFTRSGDVVANDPASHLIPSDDQVRVTYKRQQFSNVWIGKTGGIAYVIHPESVPLPRTATPRERNW